MRIGLCRLSVIINMPLNIGSNQIKAQFVIHIGLKTEPPILK